MQPFDPDYDDEAPIGALDVARARDFLLRLRVAAAVAAALVVAALAGNAVVNAQTAREARQRADLHREAQHQQYLRLTAPVIHDGADHATVVEGDGAVFLVDHGVVVAGGVRR